MIRYISLLVMIIAVSGCAQPQLQQAQVTLNSVNYLNPDVSGKAAPIMVTFYELSSPALFQQADYFSLANNPEQVLQNSLIDQRSLEMQPGQKQNYSLYLSPGVKYIGVIAGYRNIDAAVWRKVIELPQGHRQVAVTVNLTANQLQVSQMSGGWL